MRLKDYMNESSTKLKNLEPILKSGLCLSGVSICLGLILTVSESDYNFIDESREIAKYVTENIKPKIYELMSFIK